MVRGGTPDAPHGHHRFHRTSPVLPLPPLKIPFPIQPSPVIITGRGTRVRDDRGKLWFNILDCTAGEDVDTRCQPAQTAPLVGSN